MPRRGGSIGGWTVSKNLERMLVKIAVKVAELAEAQKELGFSFESRARYTSPIPPEPIRASIS